MIKEDFIKLIQEKVPDGGEVKIQTCQYPDGETYYCEPNFDEMFEKKYILVPGRDHRTDF